VYLGGHERVRVTNHSADVEVVLPVLDRDVEWVPALVEVCHDRLDPPIAVPVDDVARIAACEQVGIQPLVLWPWLGMWPDADLLVAQ